MSRRNRTDKEFLDELEGLFCADGFLDLTIGRIAELMSCSRRRLYQVADTKEQLILMIVGRLFQKLRVAGWVAADREKEFPEKMRAYLFVGQEMARLGSNRFLSDLLAFPPTREVFDLHQKERVDGLKSIIEEGVRAGVFTDINTQLVAEMMFAAVRRLREPSLLVAADCSFEEALRDFSRLMQLGLILRDAPSPASQASRVDG